MLWMVASSTLHSTNAFSPSQPSGRPATVLNAGFNHQNDFSSLRDTTTSFGATANPTVEYSVVESSASFPDSLLSTSNLSAILSAALLITGNTVGAGCLVLPEVAAGPGMAITTVAFIVSWLMNLLSAVVITDLTISAADDGSKPTSFQDLATTHFRSPAAGTVVSALSVLCNACVLAFDLRQSGIVGAASYNTSSAPSISLAVAASLVAVLTTRSTPQLARVGNLAVTVVLLTMGAVLVPGLAAVSDVGATFGGAPSTTTTTSTMLPIVLMSLVFQNIVPTVVQLLDYQRESCVAALTLGSFVPLLLYVAWCIAGLGGGLDAVVVGSSSSNGMLLLTGFTLATLGGSSLCSSMSLANEFTSLFPIGGRDDDKPAAGSATNNKAAASFPAALMAVAVPLAAALFWQDSSGRAGLTDALALAGSVGSPLLYGVLPALMVWQNNKTSDQEEEELEDNDVAFLPLPSSVSSLLLGVGSSAFVGHELLEKVSPLS